MGKCCLRTPSSSLIDNSFKLPSPLPTWPHGNGFAEGTIDLGKLEVCQISSLNKVWATHKGGPENLGASFFEPSQIPQGFFMLGCYTQPNNRPLYGWVLVAKDKANNDALKKPTNYILIWSSESLKHTKQDSYGYFWLPTAPAGYKPVGLVVTSSPQKPPLEKIRCVRSDLTDRCEIELRIWRQKKFSVYSLMPCCRGIKAMGVCVGTFVAQNGNVKSINISLACLKNVSSNKFSCMPNIEQVRSIFQEYSPRIYLHPQEKYLPSSVSWYFENGTLLYKNVEVSNPEPIESSGSNLPQNGSDDDEYWLDLPKNDKAKERVKKGDLQEVEVYLHIKPMLGATFTDIAVWVFFPFNGPGKLNLCKLMDIPLGRRTGQHVGDWEHVTLRVSNFTGELWSVYFSQHSTGSWVHASDLEYEHGSNKVIAYASLNGHAMFAKPVLVLQGCSGCAGTSNRIARSNMVLDSGVRFSVVNAEYLGEAVSEPPWLNYYRKWGPKIKYCKTVEKIRDKICKCLPKELFGEEGPTGPKMKSNWSGDELENEKNKAIHEKENLDVSFSF